MDVLEDNEVVGVVPALLVVNFVELVVNVELVVGVEPLVVVPEAVVIGVEEEEDELLMVV